MMGENEAIGYMPMMLRIETSAAPARASAPEAIVRALRCTSTPNEDCIGRECPFYVEEDVPEDMARELGRIQWPGCDVEAIGMAAADLIERMRGRA